VSVGQTITATVSDGLAIYTSEFSASTTITYDPATKKSTLDPAATLKRGARYVATVTTGAKDLAGNALDQAPNTAGNQARVWSFTVKR
jgi:hypothetical protein